MQIIVSIFLTIIVLFCSYEPLGAQGFASLTANPRRVVIDGRSRSGAVTLSNNGTKAATYRIRFVDFIATEDGKIEQINDAPADHPSARNFLRYSPRQIVLGPGESQLIRILARRPKELPDGEYRAHIVIQVLPDLEGTTSDVEVLEEGTDNTLRGTITPTYGMALPVIVMKGEPKAEGHIGNTLLKREEGNDQITVELLREGNASIYGDLEAVWTTSKGDKIELGVVRGIAVYNPYPRRRFTMTLQLPEKLALSGGSINIVYRDTETGDVIAEARHDLAS